jgi:hypothetical protein
MLEDARQTGIFKPPPRSSQHCGRAVTDGVALINVGSSANIRIAED